MNKQIDEQTKIERSGCDAENDHNGGVSALMEVGAMC